MLLVTGNKIFKNFFQNVAKKTHPKLCVVDGDTSVVRGCIKRGGADRRSFSIKSKSVAKELSNCKLKNKKMIKKKHT